MGDVNHNAGLAGAQQPLYTANGGSDDQNGNPSIGFQSQFDQFPLAQPHDDASNGQPQRFNMNAMAHALPYLQQPPMNFDGKFGSGPSSGTQPPHGMQQMQQPGYPSGQGDLMSRVRAQQMHQGQYMYAPYTAVSHAHPSMPRMQIPPQYNTLDFYGYGGSPRSPHPGNPQFAHAGAHHIMPGARSDVPHYARRTSEAAPVPSFPRGPPRKPKQSGHALWVGNLPPGTHINDLKDHFSQEATRDIESVFLISKSNCAFVNYRSEKACSEAMTRFHDSRFHGVRLVCRLRRGTGAKSNPASKPVVIDEDGPTAAPHGGIDLTDEPSGASQDPEDPVIVGGGHVPSSTTEHSNAVTGSDQTRQRVPERYFVVKSLTVQDLESSIRTGIWATQNHNESNFNEAYHNTDNVYLIFSANKSGEYFGYAKMTSAIEGQPVNLNTREGGSEPPSSGTPHAIETPATATAPKGLVIDDSGRGTIFWEAILSHEDDADQQEQAKNAEGYETTPGSNWGRQFSIEWISTARMPFYRTRGLRNPWNSNREVKIARDGTELEPSIGRRLVNMFHQSPSNAGHQQQFGMSYR